MSFQSIERRTVKVYEKKEEHISSDLGSFKSKLKTRFPLVSSPDSLNESKISIVFTREPKTFSLAWVDSNLEYFSTATYYHII